LDPSPNSLPGTGTTQDVSTEPLPAATPQRPVAVPGQPRRLGPLPLDWRAYLIAGTVAGLLLVLTIAWAGTGYRYEPYVEAPAVQSGGAASDPEEPQPATTRLRGRERQLLARLKAAAPRGVYVVIDQTHNRLYLKRDDDTLLEAACSAGSGMVLKESSG
jgi:hypothetical protein